MPNRILRDGILTSQAVIALSPLAELFYRRLMSVADDFGRYYADPQILLSHCYPVRPEWATVDALRGWLMECQVELISVYEVKSTFFLEIHNFGQRVREGRVSKFPAFGGNAPHVAANGGSRASSPTPTPTPHSSLDFISEENSETRARDVSTELVPVVPQAPLRDAGYRAFMGIFLELGMAISEADQMQCARLWVSLSDQDARAAPVWATTEHSAVWSHRALEYVPRPKTVLREKQWQRRAVVNGRDRPATKAERGQDVAARMFMREG